MSAKSISGTNRKMIFFTNFTGINGFFCTPVTGLEKPESALWKINHVNMRVYGLIRKNSDEHQHQPLVKTLLRI
jgi:hypothetical protein